ncbi:hypothetical protein BC828DRAFT_161434 [Blastocladiella britannica]|nr:hypothetical protein BC828DRAFT_161434 [Blastocladiella britannica]
MSPRVLAQGTKSSAHPKTIFSIRQPMRTTTLVLTAIAICSLLASQVDAREDDQHAHGDDKDSSYLSSAIHGAEKVAEVKAFEEGVKAAGKVAQSGINAGRDIVGSAMVDAAYEDDDHSLEDVYSDQTLLSTVMKGAKFAGEAVGRAAGKVGKAGIKAGRDLYNSAGETAGDAAGKVADGAKVAGETAGDAAGKVAESDAVKKGFKIAGETAGKATDKVGEFDAFKDGVKIAEGRSAGTKSRHDL